MRVLNSSIVAKHRRDVLLAAVKAFDGMTFPSSKT
jgi:hypothetical protein